MKRLIKKEQPVESQSKSIVAQPGKKMTPEEFTAWGNRAADAMVKSLNRQALLDYEQDKKRLAKNK